MDDARQSFLEFLQDEKTRTDIATDDHLFTEILAEAIHEHAIAPTALSAQLGHVWTSGQIADWLIDIKPPEASQRLSILDALVKLLT